MIREEVMYVTDDGRRFATHEAAAEYREAVNITHKHPELDDLRLLKGRDVVDWLRANSELVREIIENY